MESIIEQLYVLQLENETEKSDFDNKEEYALYEKLCQSLAEKQRKEFEKFVELYGERLIINQEKMYKKGFKTACALIKELIE